MLSFNDIKSKAVSTFVAKKNLDSGILPSLEEVASQIIQDYNDTEVYKSMIQNKHYIEPKEIASSEKINSIQDAVTLDINTLYEFIKYLAEYISSELKNVSNQISAANSELDRLHTILDNKILELKNSDGLFNVEEIDLFSNININDTDSAYDVNSRIITVSKNTDSIDLNLGLEIESIKFSPVTTPYLSILQYPNYPFSNMYDNSLYTEWISSIFVSTSYVGSVEGRLDVKFRNNISINSIKMIFASLNTNLKYSICVKANIAGTTTLLSPYTQYVDTAIVDFETITTNNLSIYIVSDKYSSISALRDAKEYKFTMLSLSIGSVEYNPMSSHVINYSKNFNLSQSYSLISTDIIPSGCKVEYYFVNEDGPQKITPINHGTSDDNFYGSPIQLKQAITTKNIDLTIIDDRLYGSNIAFRVSNESYSLLLRGVDTFLKNDKTLSCVLFNQSLNSIIDFKNTPGYLNDKYVNYKIILNEYFYTFTFENNIENINTYFDVFDSWKNSFPGSYYGSVIAEKIDMNRFFNVIDDDDITKFYMNIVKKSVSNINRDNNYLFDKEQILLIASNSTNNSLVSKILIKLYSYNNQTPVVKQLKIKSSTWN